MGYKVLLVDDEALIREAIKENIDWEGLGFTLMAACENGRDAMEVIDREVPDLLLTDINMPFVDGMELSRYVCENYPNTKIIIISGYDEFEFAKKAVQYRVLEYILKPMTAAELIDVLKKAKAVLDEAHGREQNLKRLRSAYNSNLPVMQARFLKNLLQPGPEPDLSELRTQCQALRISLAGQAYNTAIVEADDLSAFTKEFPDTQESLAGFAIYNISKELIEEAGIGTAFQDSDRRTILVFTIPEDYKEEDGTEFCASVIYNVYRYSGIEVTVSLGKIVPSIVELSRSYTAATAVHEQRFFVGGGQVLDSSFIPAGLNVKTPVVDVNSWSERAATHIKENDYDKIHTEVVGFEHDIRHSGATRNRTILYVQSFLLMILNKISLSDQEEDQAVEWERDIINQIYSYQHLKEMMDDVEDFCRKLSDSIAGQKDSYGKRQAILAQEYIEQNYADSNLSLNAVCGYLSVSTSYFSSMFKAYTGETFVEAVTRRRMEEAIRLLGKSTLRVYEVAEKVGFSDSHYFSVAFKKYTGKSPAEYAREKR